MRMTKRKLTTKQKKTLRERGQVTVQIWDFGMDVRPVNVHDGCIEYYGRKYETGVPVLRNYKKRMGLTKRELTTKQKNTLLRTGKVELQIFGFDAEVRRANVRGGCITYYRNKNETALPVLINFSRRRGG